MHPLFMYRAEMGKLLHINAHS